MLPLATLQELQTDFLQWDRAFDSAECCLLLLCKNCRATSFNGTAHLIARNELVQRRILQSLTTFNGTAHLIARNVQNATGEARKVLFLQWDRAFDSAEWSAMNASICAGDILQWDRAFDSAECLTTPAARVYLATFNGTAHLIARNALRWWILTVSKMSFNGTAHLIARNGSGLESGCIYFPAFNGTAHLIARNDEGRASTGHTITILQWDRAFDSAECRQHKHNGARCSHSFNGTAHLIARNAVSCFHVPTSQRSLQWDRAFDSAEWISFAFATLRQSFLQWDRAFDSAEWISASAAYTDANILQWDRAFDSAECGRSETCDV